MRLAQRRYAIYYTPSRNDPLARAAAKWLGRDVFNRANTLRVHRPASDICLTAEPRRYGFHATLKAPFRLRDEYQYADLETALASFARSHMACPIGFLGIVMIGPFFALVPSDATPMLNDLASEAVVEFDCFRAPPSAAELQRRRQVKLDEAELAHLLRWGYPYVFDRYRFHMTLTGPISEEQCGTVHKRLKDEFGPLLEVPFELDAISLFAQESPDDAFFAAARFPLIDRPREAGSK